MKAKEKAIELRDKYLRPLNELNSSENRSVESYARQCAIIAVNEILNANPHSNPFNTIQESTHKWWREVKHELKKL